MTMDWEHGERVSPLEGPRYRYPRYGAGVGIGMFCKTPDFTALIVF